VGISLCILAPLSWVRTLEKFRYNFIFGSFVVVGTVIIVATYDALIINDNNGEPGLGWTSFNQNGYWTMIGLSFYMFEGIPTVLPIMDASDAKPYFSTLIIAALATLCVINIAFSELCYYTFGEGLTEPIVIL
jgi:amino acid permease